MPLLSENQISGIIHHLEQKNDIFPEDREIQTQYTV